MATPAKNTPPATPAAIAKAASTAPVASQSAPEGADEETVAEQAALDDGMSALLGDKNLAAMFDKLNKAKDEDFGAKVVDFWNPEKEGDELRGIYVGKAKAGRLTQYGLAVKGDDGKVRGVRLNGTHSLTSAFRTIEPKTAVRIVYKGKTTTKGMVAGISRELKQFVVTPLK